MARVARRWYRAGSAAELDPRAMARTLGGVGLAGSLLALVWVALPSPAQTNHVADAGLALIGAAMSAAVLTGALDRAPRAMFEVAVAIATVLISAGIYFAEVRGTGLPFLYMWCLPYAYWFFPRRRALLQALFVVVCFAVATLSASEDHASLAGRMSQDWSPLLLLTGTVLIVGELVRQLAATIAEGRERFAAAFRRAPTPMARIGAGGRYVDANDAFCRAVGRPHAELIGLHYMELVPDYHRAMVAERGRRLSSGISHVEEYERDYIRPDGSRVTLMLTNSLLGAPGEPDTEVFVQALDVTQRKMAEQALTESERRYRTLVEASQAVVWASDLDGRMTYVNDAVREVFGYEPEEVRGENFSRYLPEAHRGAVQDALERLRAGRAVTGEVDVYRADGGRIITSYSIASLDDENGDAVGFVGTLLDVTDRRRAAEAHRISEARLRAVIENAPAAITIRRADGRLLVANRAAAALLGADPASLTGTAHEGGHGAEPTSALRRLDARALAEGPIVSEISLEREDGEHIYVTAGFPLPGGRGEEQVVCRMSFDITDREHARRELERSHEERRRLLAELVRAQEDERRRIAADVHDESIQVLAGVAIRLGMLSGMLDRPEQRRLIEGLDDSVRRGIKSLRQLLFDLRLPALDELGLAAALRSYLSETIAREGVTYALEDSLGEVEPPAELRTVLYRVAQEALSNVRKHAQASHVEVVLTGSAESVEVSVRDDGVGFALGPDRRDVPGHLGMVGMRERIGAAGGWIEIDSEPGAGTVIRFGVPLPAAVNTPHAALSGA